MLMYILKYVHILNSTLRLLRLNICIYTYFYMHFYTYKYFYLFSNLRESRVNQKDLRALTSGGSTRNNPVLDPLAVLHLDN